jgi:hypothetical protein
MGGKEQLNARGASGPQESHQILGDPGDGGRYAAGVESVVEVCKDTVVLRREGTWNSSTKSTVLKPKSRRRIVSIYFGVERKREQAG